MGREYKKTNIGKGNMFLFKLRTQELLIKMRVGDLGSGSVAQLDKSSHATRLPKKKSVPTNVMV